MNQKLNNNYINIYIKNRIKTIIVAFEFGNLNLVIDALKDKYREVRQFALLLLSENNSKTAKESIYNHLPFSQMYLLYNMTNNSYQFPEYFDIANYNNTLVIYGEINYKRSYLRIWDILTKEIKNNCQLMTHGFGLGQQGKTAIYNYQHFWGVECTDNLKYSDPDSWSMNNIDVLSSHRLLAISKEKTLIVTEYSLSNVGELAIINYESKETKLYYKFKQLVLNYSNYLKDRKRLEISPCIFSPQGKLLITSFRKYNCLNKNIIIKIWNTQTGELIQTLDELPSLAITSLGITPKGQIIACGIRKYKISVWELQTDIVIHTVNELNPCILSSDGRILIYATKDNTIIIWDLLEQKQLNTLYGHNSPVAYLAMSKDREFIASYDKDNCIRVWGLKT